MRQQLVVAENENVVQGKQIEECVSQVEETSVAKASGFRIFLFLEQNILRRFLRGLGGYG